MRFIVLAVAAAVVASSSLFPGLAWAKADQMAATVPPAAAVLHVQTTGAAPAQVSQL
jgi:hypothetical protein